ncbi:unnamed protein product [Caenorhabditis sp. 36 PRJEB53466]|nr:unnamed protein product [Caenorhabditis sp. 36 PRJEB53466]
MEPSKEFPGIPLNFEDLNVLPDPFDTSSDKMLTLQNHSKVAVLFKVKCTSNARLKIEECADVLRPGNETTVPITKLSGDVAKDKIYVIYTLVGKQWHDEKMSAYRCWERVKKQAIGTRCITISVGKESKKKKKKETKEEEKKEKSKDEDENRKDRNNRKEERKDQKDRTKSED